jgi:hypothetical protein
LLAPTVGSTAASYWIRPIHQQIWPALVHQVRRPPDLSTSGPDPEVPVEYDNIATRGSMPNFDAVCAELIAISANCSDLGFRTIAQSPVDEDATGQTHQKNA